MTCKFMAALGLLTAAAFGGSSSRYERTSAEELRAAIERCPVAYIPAGILEWHGEQSACGLDALKAETLCRMAADTLGGVCFPQIWLGPDASTPFDPTKYPRGTVTIDKAAYYAAAEQILARIENMGFKVAVYLSGHYPGVIPEVVEKFNQHGGMKVITLSENMAVQGMPAGDHAGAWETSVLMVLRPGLVDLGRLPALPPSTRPAGEVIPPPHEFRQRTELYGIYQLDPRVWANEHYGRRGVEAVIDGLARDVGKALDDPKYGQNRPRIDWPKDDRRNPEVRYDHLLPQQWMRRFAQKPVVYVPIVAADDSIDATVDTATGWAQQTGGMVFPPIGYAPCEQQGRPQMSGETYKTVMAEIVADLVDMDFRVISLVAGDSVAPDLLRQLGDIRAPNNQSAVLVGSRSEKRLPPAVSRAIAATVPGEDASEIRLDGPWQVDDRDTIYSLSEDRFGPNNTRAYVYEWTCSAEDAAKAASLELGAVRNKAEVTINDGPVLVDHWPPYHVLISGMLEPGNNRIKIVVKNELQPTLDYFFHQPGLPRLQGPVRLQMWSASLR